MCWKNDCGCGHDKLEGLVETAQLSLVHIDLVFAFSDHERMELEFVLKVSVCPSPKCSCFCVLVNKPVRGHEQCLLGQSRCIALAQLWTMTKVSIRKK